MRDWNLRSRAVIEIDSSGCKIHLIPIELGSGHKSGMCDVCFGKDVTVIHELATVNVHVAAYNLIQRFRELQHGARKQHMCVATHDFSSLVLMQNTHNQYANLTV